MKATLSPYHTKRDFSVTSEPEGKVTKPGKSLAFVVQKHAASRLHYDFRLELGGTLKSWAVPKGPSLDPAVKRMAVHVEDHPLAYARFEGVIPKGQYGAGTVEIWDKGTWEPVGDAEAGYREGKLKFELKGTKLTGRWTLVRMRGKGEKQEPWLLIKEKVGAAPAATTGSAKARAAKAALARPTGVKAPLPAHFKPQLATLVESPPRGEGWVYEVKFDGYRLLARVEGGDVQLFTRNGNNWTSKLAGLHDEVAALGIDSAWIDGEIVVLDRRGNPSFQALQNAFDSAKTSGIVFFAFDLPHCDGRDLTHLPLLERRRMLQELLAAHPSERVRFSEAFDAPVESLLESACRKGLEGLIGKRADAPYVSRRSNAWIKLKCTRRQEFVVAGYTDPKGSRTGFGALLLGIHDSEGKLVYAGNVGTGFDQQRLDSLAAKLKASASPKPPFEAAPKGVKAHWVRPKLVAEVSFTEWTSDGRIRHPVFHGLRSDKGAATITREEAAPATGSVARAKRRAASPGAAPRVTHPERVIDAASGATKLDLVEYYDWVHPHMLPHLAGRPVALVRAPKGVGGELFFQKHDEKSSIAGVVQLDPSFWPGHPPMIEVASREALVGAAQMNVIELHTWNSTTRDIAHPDRVIFDLDPGEGVAWEMVKEAAALTKQMLDLLGLASFLKTSGGKGLHVVVPLTPKWDYDRVKDFSELLVAHMARALPTLFVSKSGPRNRVGKIFIDYLRNGRGATTVAAYSARARPGLGVSVPVAWSELASLAGGDQWNIFTLRERFARKRADPWKKYASTGQRLEAALRKLERE